MPDVAPLDALSSYRLIIICASAPLSGSEARVMLSGDAPSASLFCRLYAAASHEEISARRRRAPNEPRACERVLMRRAIADAAARAPMPARRRRRHADERDRCLRATMPCR